MATIVLSIDQTDNGKNLLISDISTWTDITDTGVTAVVITITDPDGTEYEVINESPTQPLHQNDLTWTIPATDVGFTDGYYDDGKYGLVVEYTTTPTSDPVEVDLYLDWETKYYDFQLVKDLSYRLENNQFAYDSETEKSIVFDLLKKGMQYSASVGQTAKADYILEVIEKFKKIQV